MSSWWDKKWNKSKICGITHSRLRPGKNKYGTPYVIHIKCGHSFYTNALLEWMRMSTTNSNTTTCPLCRYEFTLQELLDYDIKSC